MIFLIFTPIMTHLIFVTHLHSGAGCEGPAPRAVARLIVPGALTNVGCIPSMGSKVTVR